MSENGLVLGFPGYREPAQRLAAAAGHAYADVQVHHFPDGECRVQLPPALPARVSLCRSLDRPNERLVELLLAAAAARDLGARQLTLVAPYLCYMRQDIAFRPGEAVSQRIIGRLLAEYFNALITVDPHLHRVSRLGQAVPVARAEAVSAAPLLSAWLGERAAPPVVIGPDTESAQWVQAIAGPAGLDCAVATKQRLGDRQVQLQLPAIDVAGREVVLVDDIASTGRTLAAAAGQLRAAGASGITVLVSHALFVDDALARLREAGVDEVCSTDSVAHESNRVQLAGLLAAALTSPDRA